MNSVLIKEGRLFAVADGFNDTVSDIYIENGIIKEIGVSLNIEADTIIDAKGCIVSPGLIDVHTHVFPGISCNGIDADIIGVNRGTTTVIDAGSVGAETFQTFYEDVILKKQTKVFSLLNISKKGLVELKELNSLDKIDEQMLREVVAKYPKEIVGLKARASRSVVGDLKLIPIEIAARLSEELNLPLMIHTGNFPPYIEEVLNLMKKGDVLTHAFHGKKGGLLNEKREVIDEAIAARNRGVLFDVGHGSASFSFNTFKRAKDLGFFPDLVSTDLHCENYTESVYSQHAVITKLINCGESLAVMLDRATRVPAECFGLEGLGRLKVGSIGDLSISSLTNSESTVYDSMGEALILSMTFAPQYTVYSHGTISTIIEHQIDSEIVIDEIDAYLCKEGISFVDANAKAAFYSHMRSLVERINKHEIIDSPESEYEAILSELDETAMRISDEITSRVFRDSKHKVTTMELILIATHIQAYFNSKQ